MRHLLRLTLVALAVAGFLLSPVPAQESAPQDGPAMEAPPDRKPTDEPRDWQASLDGRMKKVNEAVGSVFFYPIPVPGTANRDAEGTPVMTKLPFIKKEVSTLTIPFAVLWLVLGAIYFTLRMGFVQFKLVGHAIQVTRGKYDDPDDEGEVSHFEALTAALSATVGLGNIAGVALAISIGGPGATFWMILAGVLGMASKFTECSLGQMYRQERSDGSVMGGAMYYLSDGLRDRGPFLATLGKVLAIMFAILCIGGSLAGGNSFQVNQSKDALAEVVPFLKENGWAYGAVMTLAAGGVILGGLRRIADVASKIVPAMCGLYVAGCLFVILSNADQVVGAFGTIIEGAFNPQAGLGGVVGVLIVGFKRAAFSNEAGVGSAAIAHSAAKSHYAVREGIVALLEPLIDTVIVCTMTALVIVITGAYVTVDPVTGAETVFNEYIAGNNGAGLTSMAFSTVIPW
ncbi:MAG: alanine/glycine:cation symporter family protein, partial [Planctomycetota bacterium]